MSRRKRTPKSESNSNSNVAIWVAIIGVVGAIAAAVISSQSSAKLVERAIQATQSAEAQVVLKTQSAGSSLKIEFASANDSAALSTNLLWEKGGSSDSRFDLAPNTINITAGSRTWPNFPTIIYKTPIEGNFNAQVKVVFKPPAPKIKNAQNVGLIIRPINSRLVMGSENFPKNWAVVSKQLVDEGLIVGCRGTESWVDYPLDTVYLRIERDSESWRCAYSENGETWKRFENVVDDESLRNKPLEMALYAYSGTSDPITVEFSDWFLYRK